MRRIHRIFLILALLPLTACGGDPIPPTPSVATLTVAPETALLESLGETVQLQATALDADGVIVGSPSIDWTSSDEAVEVSASGVATARANGTALVTASNGGVSASVEITVSQVVDALTLTPASGLITALGETEPLAASALDARGNTVEGASVAWTSTAPTIAAVDDLGVVTALQIGTTRVTATSGAFEVEAEITVDPWQSLSTSANYTCGSLSSGAAYCWGNQNRAFGGVGPSSSSSPLSLGGTSLASVVTGSLHACGLDPEGWAHCWGNNRWGQLGDGTFESRATPAPVAGGHTFIDIAVVTPVGSDGAHTCGLSADGSAWCWGLAERGRLGVGPDIGSLTPCETDTLNETYCATEPTAVEGGIAFTDIALETSETCALEDGTSDVYCWGNGSMAPYAKSWSPALSSIASHFQHGCGTDADGTGYCWGAGVFGKLGNGSTTSQALPVEVMGGHVFSSMSAGSQHTCAVTEGGEAYCWGQNRGALGRGDTENDYVTVPSVVVGDLTFESISATGQSCGITVSGAAYCWGHNFDGQLGDGTEVARGTPVRVLDPPS